MNKVLLPFIYPNVQFDVIPSGYDLYPYRLHVSDVGDARQPFAPGLELQATATGWQIVTPATNTFDINGFNLATNGSFFINQSWGIVRQLEFVVRS